MLTIHIGNPKTGTTFLQESIFKNINDIDYIPYTDSILDILRYSNKEIFFTSYEGYIYDPYKRNLVKQGKISINKIKKIFNDPKIIFGYRKHSDYIKSLYLQSLNMGKYWSFNDFFSFNDENSLFNEKDFYLKPIIYELKQNFTDVYLYDFEDLKNDNEKIVNDMLYFLGSKMKFNDFEIKHENVSIKTQLNKLNSFTQKFFLSLYSKPFKILGIHPRILAHNYISRIRSKPLILRGFDKEKIDNHYKSDWEEIKDFI